MNFKKDGGPAYPVPVTFLDDDLGRYQGQQTGLREGWAEGMTLRDWFAGQALAGIMAASGATQPINNPMTNLPLAAYALADAMLKARETPND